MDRYGLAREFELRKFEMHVMKMTDLYQASGIAIRLFSQTSGSEDESTKSS